MRILFAGTPEIAVPSLSALAASSHPVVGVLTAPDRRAGRGRALGLSPVKSRALELGLPIFQPERLGSESREMVASVEPEILVCIAYGRIFGPKFLELFSKGGINIHPSLLPRHRGPAPIPAAILAGDTTTGVTIQQLALEMDAGDILAQEPVALAGSETTGELTERFAELGADLVVRVIDQLAEGTITPVPQDDNAATYTQLITKADGEIDWSRDAASIERAVRAYHPWPLAHTTFNGQRLNVLETHEPRADADTGTRSAAPGTVVAVDNTHGILIETGNGLLAVTRLQLQSRKALSWDTFLNGVSDFTGAVLGV